MISPLSLRKPAEFGNRRSTKSIFLVKCSRFTGYQGGDQAAHVAGVAWLDSRLYPYHLGPGPPCQHVGPVADRAGRTLSRPRQNRFGCTTAGLGAGRLLHRPHLRSNYCVQRFLLDLRITPFYSSTQNAVKLRSGVRQALTCGLPLLKRSSN